MNAHQIEASLGISSLLAGLAGAGWYLLGQVTSAPVDPSNWNVAGLTGIIAQLGGSGLAVWLVYYHTTKTIPDHNARVDKIIADHFTQVDKIVTGHLAVQEGLRKTFEESLEKVACKAKP